MKSLSSEKEKSLNAQHRVANVAFQHLKSSSDYLGFCQGLLFISLWSAGNIYCTFVSNNVLRNFKFKQHQYRFQKRPVFKFRVTIIPITTLGFSHLNASFFQTSFSCNWKLDSIRAQEKKKTLSSRRPGYCKYFLSNWKWHMCSVYYLWQGSQR